MVFIVHARALTERSPLPKTGKSDLGLLPTISRYRRHCKDMLYSPSGQRAREVLGCRAQDFMGSKLRS